MRKPVTDTIPWFGRLPSFLFPFGKRANHAYLRMQKFDKRTSYISSGIPLFIILTATVSVTTLVMDKQFELRDYRVRSLGVREMVLEEENRKLAEFLTKTDGLDDLNNSIPLPTRELEPRL